MMVDGSNYASGHNEVPIGYANDGNILLGGHDPKNRRIFTAVRKSHRKLFITFEHYFEDEVIMTT